MSTPDFERDYRENRHVFESFTNRVRSLLEDLLRTSNIKVHLLEGRTKSIESFCEKIGRKQGKYQYPIKDITDISAIRVIVFYIDDLELVEKVIGDNFVIDIENSFYTKNNLRENQFGYLSNHFVVSLKADRIRLPEWAAYNGFKVEIQVRTVLQHAWAAISHELEYKKTYDIPSTLKRKLFRLASLIELADEEFQESRERHQAVEQAIKEKKPLNDVKVFDEINLNTIQSYFASKTEELNLIKKNAVKAGFKIRNTKREDSLSDIVEVCKLKGINSIDKFNEVIVMISKSSLQHLRGIYNINGTPWSASIDFIVLLLLLFTLSEDQLDLHGRKGWGESVWQSVRQYAMSLK